MTSDNPDTKPNDATETENPYGERNGPRVVYDETTGYSFVTARPGEPMITNEEIKRLLEDFP